MTKFHEERTKIVDLLLTANFGRCALFFTQSLNEFNPTSEVQNIGNGAFQNTPFANIPFANGSFPNGGYSCLWAIPRFKA